MESGEERKKMEKAFRVAAAKLITDSPSETNWKQISSIFMLSEEAESISRLYRSQMFRDPDYPDNVSRFLDVAFEKSPERTVSMIAFVIEDLIKRGSLTESELERYPIVKAMLENKQSRDFSVLIPKIRSAKYLEVKELPDDFYRDLVDVINEAFAYGMYIVVDLLARKLLENLLVDLLRKKYSVKNVDLFYDKHHNRFHDFSILVKNFEDKISDFKPIVPALEGKCVTGLETFREKGNSAAHTLETRVTESELMARKQLLEDTTKTLVRLYNNC